MKQIKALVLITAISMAFFACNKDSGELTPATQSPTVQAPKGNGNVNGVQTWTPWAYSSLVSSLISRGYSFMSTPGGYVPLINLSSYPGSTLHLYIQGSTIVEVVKFPNPSMATVASGDNGCTQQETVLQNGTAGCYQTGNDCRVVSDVINGTLIVTIICC